MISHMEIVPCVSGISRSDFRRHFLRANRPVVVQDGLVDSPSTRHWQPAYFRQRFGDLPVAVSGDFFSPAAVIKLADFINLVEHLECTSRIEVPSPYLRLAYPDFGGVDFTSVFFDALKHEWQQPYFLPRCLYAVPFTLIGKAPNLKRFPEWGLFISPRGGLTAIHIDRTNDNTILAAACGKKAGFLFEPTTPVLEFLAREHHAREQGQPSSAKRRTEAALRGELPDYPGLEAHYFELGPGEVLFIPKRWAHEVFTLSACISLTYNFIHLSDIDRSYLCYRVFGLGFH